MCKIISNVVINIVYQKNISSPLTALHSTSRHTLIVQRSYTMLQAYMGSTLTHSCKEIQSWSIWENQYTFTCHTLCCYLCSMGCTLHQHGHTHVGGSSHSHGQSENINVRAAFIHVIGDFLQSAGVFVAALVIYFYVSIYLIYKLFLHICYYFCRSLKEI